MKSVVLVLALIAGACSRAPEPPRAVMLGMENPPGAPVTGTNTITVTVKESDGTAISDAAVNGELFMPVMESMGKSVVVFRPEGNGRYVGEGILSMAGSWQITVTAKRAGQTLATRTFNLTTKS